MKLLQRVWEQEFKNVFKELKAHCKKVSERCGHGDPGFFRTVYACARVFYIYLFRLDDHGTTSHY